MRVSLAMVALVAAVSLGGCFEGPQGPAGATGPQGPQGAAGPPGPAGPAGSANLHALRQDTCADNTCEIACSTGEKLVSVTCPGATIAISNEGASCSNTPGPALALCLKP